MHVEKWIIDQGKRYKWRPWDLRMTGPCAPMQVANGWFTAYIPVTKSLRQAAAFKVVIYLQCILLDMWEACSMEHQIYMEMAQWRHEKRKIDMKMQCDRLKRVFKLLTQSQTILRQHLLGLINSRTQRVNQCLNASKVRITGETFGWKAMVGVAIWSGSSKVKRII